MQAAIDAAEGGVLVIDEAYAIGNETKLDSFSKEIIDVLNKNLTDPTKKFICIIVGYENDINACLFAHNPGLKSRFRFKYQIKPYTSNEMACIMKSKVDNGKWLLGIELADLDKFFNEKRQYFKAHGRDIQNLISFIKSSYCTRHFTSLNFNAVKTIYQDDFNAGYKKYISHVKPKDVKSRINNSMYL